MDAYLSQFAEPTGYLDFARFGPPSRAVLDTTAELMRQAAHAGPGTVDALMAEDGRARDAVARLVGADADHVVVLPNTSLGLVQAAFGCSGRVLVPATDFPANTYPWVKAEQAGLVKVDWLTGPATPDAIAAALTPETAAVTVAAVDFRTGYRMDLAAVREIVGDRLLIVDAIQGFGAVTAAWEAADVLVAGGQKWLRAGWGTGFGVLSDAALERLRPLVASWAGARDPMVFDNEIREPADTAARWKITHLSPFAAGALAAALELVEGVGVAAIEARIAERVGRLGDVVRSAGGRVLSQATTVLSFAMPDIPRAGAALREHGVAATVRPGHIRLSPHASTTVESIDAVRVALAG
ncbi:phosphoserine aminotransferase [Actinokineospora sp. UTMC 2448]|nr:phosphoserine aminotransferase [Actinokineospora sp. UTMC 2448]